MTYKKGDKVTITGTLLNQDSGNTFWVEIDRPHKSSLLVTPRLHISQFEHFVPPEPMGDVEFVVDKTGDIWVTNNTHLWVRRDADPDEPDPDVGDGYIWPHLWRNFGPLRAFSEVKL